MDFLDMYLKRAVLACSQMMEADAGTDALTAFHYAVGLSLMGDRSGDGTPVPQITLDGLDALHATAHSMADTLDFDLQDYATVQIAGLRMALEFVLAGH